MANLFQSLLKWLYHRRYKKPSPEANISEINQYKNTNHQQDDDDGTCKVIFIMRDGGDIEINMDWPANIKDIKNIASNYAALISVINYGGFKEDIKKILIDAKKDYSNNKTCDSYRFLSYTLSRMAEAQKITDLNSDSPIVEPRQAFTYNNIKR